MNEFKRSLTYKSTISNTLNKLPFFEVKDKLEENRDNLDSPQLIPMEHKPLQFQTIQEFQSSAEGGHNTSDKIFKQ